MQEAIDGISNSLRSRGTKNAPISDAGRVLRKFGQPNERLGIGKTPRSEHGIRYDRKWNYFYSSRPGTKATMRTVYFLDNRFAGSVVHGPDGSVQKEKVRFPY